MILVTGAAGMAGWHVVREALARDLPVQGLWHKEPLHQFPVEIPTHQCDLLDHAGAAELVARLRPSAVVHCAGLTNVDLCEERADFTMDVNARGTGALARAAHACGARFIHFSSDSVYDGSRPGWSEDDEPNPVNVYARSKLEAGRLIAAVHDDYLILRTNFYGKHPVDGRALASWILGRLASGQDVPGFTDVVFSPLWVGDLARMVVDLAADSRYTTARGVLNLGGDGAVSKFDFARKLAAAAGYDPARVVPTLSTDIDFKAARPRDTTMNVGRALGLFGSLPTIDEGIAAFVDDLRQRGALARPE